jgi:amino acid permease
MRRNSESLPLQIVAGAGPLGALSDLDRGSVLVALKNGLKPRQMQMIAIGGAIGTGLFLGPGGRLGSAGPALA